MQVMQEPDFWVKEAASFAARLQTAAQSHLQYPCLSAIIGLHLYSLIRKENSYGTGTDGCPLSWDVGTEHMF